MANYSPGTLIGPGNVISANLIGILISGAVGRRRDRPRQPDRHRFNGQPATWATPRTAFRLMMPPGIRSKETTWVCR